MFKLPQQFLPEVVSLELAYGCTISRPTYSVRFHEHSSGNKVIVPGMRSTFNVSAPIVDVTGGLLKS